MTDEEINAVIEEIRKLIVPLQAYVDEMKIQNDLLRKEIALLDTEKSKLIQ